MPVAIIASGPSAKRADLTLLRGRARVIAIKQTFDLCPWADMVYGCDEAWWRFRKGLPEFKGLKVSWVGSDLPDYRDIKRVTIPPGDKVKYTDEIQTERGLVGGGGNSGFQALNIALWLGASHVILIGFDMDDKAGAHWYGRNRWPGSNNPDRYNFMRWVPAFEKAAPVLASKGVSVFNASPSSAIKSFPFKTIEQALADYKAPRKLDLAGLRSA